MLENNKKRCTGCGACVWKCPKQCITWNIEELGFRYPVIDMSECVNCGVCENVCPIDKQLSSRQDKEYTPQYIRIRRSLQEVPVVVRFLQSLHIF